MRSFHGKAMMLGSNDLRKLGSATCTSCHGTHDIKKAEDPTSPVAGLTNLARTCEQCHPGAGENFASGFMGHREASPESFPLVYFAERFFTFLTATVVAFGIFLVGMEVTRTIHRFAAWVMVFDCVYHLAYLSYNFIIKGKPFPIWMLPQPKDVSDFFLEVKYYMGLTQQKPRFDRYNFPQKFDYWAIFWGMPVMAGSGFILMYPVSFAQFLPGGIIPVALVAHSDEAVLAVAWIFVVQFFFAHLAPNVFPINWTIFTGRISRERYQEEHPLDYQRVLAREARQEGSPSTRPSPQKGSGAGEKPTGQS